MADEYTLKKMIDTLSQYFQDQGYSTDDYPKRLYNIRLPLNCLKWKDEEIDDEIVVEIITEEVIKKDAYLHDKHFGKFLVKNASSVRFFQHYLPKSRVYWAYGNYVKKDDEVWFRLNWSPLIMLNA